MTSKITVTSQGFQAKTGTFTVKETGSQIELAIHNIFNDFGADRDGNIYSLKNHKSTNSFIVRMLSEHVDLFGYCVTSVHQNGMSKSIKAHRFTWECWNGEIPKHLEIDHIDSNKNNNSLSNLRLVDHKTNTQNRIRTKNGTKPTLMEIIDLRKDFEDGMTYRTARTKYNLSIDALHKIKTYRTYTTLTIEIAQDQELSAQYLKDRRRKN